MNVALYKPALAVGRSVTRQSAQGRHLRTRMVRVLVVLGVVSLLQACATPGALTQARNQFYSGQPEAALATLDARDVSRRNRLLAELDKGLIAHTAGQYEASSEAFLKAVDLIEKLDVISISEQTTSLITSEWANSYRGEYSERLWVHSFQMMNFLMLNKPESAAVEARQALKLFETRGKILKRDWFTRSLIALSFEAAGQYESAHIEYRKLMDDLGKPDTYSTDRGFLPAAWRNATRLGRSDDAKRFADALPDTPTNTTQGELVIFVESGAIPQKQPGDITLSIDTRIAFPFYPEFARPPLRIRTASTHNTPPADVVSTQLVGIASDALAARGKAIATKQVLRIAAKREVSRQASRENEALGALVQTILFVLEQADTRSWETLPAHLALVRIPLDAGTHNIEIDVEEGARQTRLSFQDVSIEAGQRTYRAVRTGPGAPQGILLDEPDALP